MKAERDRRNPYLMASVISLKLAAGLLVQCERIGGGGSLQVFGIASDGNGSSPELAGLWEPHL